MNATLENMVRDLDYYAGMHQHAQNMHYNLTQWLPCIKDEGERREIVERIASHAEQIERYQGKIDVLSQQVRDRENAAWVQHLFCSCRNCAADV